MGRGFTSSFAVENFHDAELGYRWSRARSRLVFHDPGASGRRLAALRVLGNMIAGRQLDLAKRAPRADARGFSSARPRAAARFHRRRRGALAPNALPPDRRLHARGVDQRCLELRSRGRNPLRNLLSGSGGRTCSRSFDSRRQQLLLGIRDEIMRTNPRVSLSEAFEYAALIMEASDKYPSVDPLMFLSIGIVESRYDGRATSQKNAKGLYQIWPSTGRLLARSLDWEYSATLSSSNIWRKRAG